MSTQTDTYTDGWNAKSDDEAVHSASLRMAAQDITGAIGVLIGRNDRTAVTNILTEDPRRSGIKAVPKPKP
jgi:hypothetical protein